MLREAEQRAVAMLKEHRDVLDRLVELLIDKETVGGAQVYALARSAQPDSGAGMTVAPERAAATKADHRAVAGRKGSDGTSDPPLSSRCRAPGGSRRGVGWSVCRGDRHCSALTRTATPSTRPSARSQQRGVRLIESIGRGSDVHRDLCGENERKLAPSWRVFAVTLRRVRSSKR